MSAPSTETESEAEETHPTVERTATLLDFVSALGAVSIPEATQRILDAAARARQQNSRR
jgi:hypothetical protein